MGPRQGRAPCSARRGRRADRRQHLHRHRGDLPAERPRAPGRRRGVAGVCPTWRRDGDRRVTGLDLVPCVAHVLEPRTRSERAALRERLRRLGGGSGRTCRRACGCARRRLCCGAARRCSRAPRSVAAGEAERRCADGPNTDERRGRGALGDRRIALLRAAASDTDAGGRRPALCRCHGRCRARHVCRSQPRLRGRRREGSRGCAPRRRRRRTRRARRTRARVARASHRRGSRRTVGGRCSQRVDAQRRRRDRDLAAHPPAGRDAARRGPRRRVLCRGRSARGATTRQQGSAPTSNRNSRPLPAHRRPSAGAPTTSPASKRLWRESLAGHPTRLESSRQTPAWWSSLPWCSALRPASPKLTSTQRSSRRKCVARW